MFSLHSQPFVAFGVGVVTPGTLVSDKSVQVGMKKAEVYLHEVCGVLRAQGNC